MPAIDQPLEARHRDHDPNGDWAGDRACHVKPDLLLIDQNRMRTPDAGGLGFAQALSG
jgi:mRNA interferase YafQ